MSMKLSSEKEHLVLDNQRLVYYLVKQLEVTPNSSDYEDIVSIGTVGLIKAAIAFDSSKKIKFSTYASRCIENEIFMYYRKANKYAYDISLYEPIGVDEEGEEFTLEEKIEYSDSNFIDKIVDNEEFIQLTSIVLNYLEGKNRLVMLYRMGNLSQINIADMLHISRSYVARIESKATLKIREVANNQEHYKEVFSMDIIGDEYRISFSSKDISKFNKIFVTLLQNLVSAENSPDFKINYNRERIVVQMPAHPESFSFIAKIIQKIDDFSMAFVSDKSTLPAGNTVMQKVESDDAGETDAESRIEKGSRIKQVRDYMLSMSSFTIKDLKHHFPNLTIGTINNAVYLAKNKGLITATGRAKYIVNKT